MSGSNYVGRPPGQVLAPGSSGRLVQTLSTVRTDFLSQAGSFIPGDDTIPQIGEGAEYLLVPNYAALAVGNRIRIRVQFAWGASAIIQMIAALFQSGTANALAAGVQVNPAADWEMLMNIEHEFLAASVAPFNYSFRAGPNAAGAALRMNGRAARILGGVAASFLRIDEYSA